MHQFLFLDTETTGVDKDDRLFQIAYRYDDKTVNELFKPPVPISHVASSITHVTNKDVALKLPFAGSDIFNELKELAEKDYILVAHNAAFDLGMLRKEGIEFKRHICTMKIARHIDEGQFVNHQLQYLRYFYDLNIDTAGLPAHDALADIIVLEAVFKQLANIVKHDNSLSKEETIDKLLEISSNPSLMKHIRFGKYRDMPEEEQRISVIAKKDPSYLIWLLNEKKKKPEEEEDWLYTLTHYLNK